MSERNYSQHRGELIQLCKSVGNFIREQIDLVNPKDIVHKEMNSLVSYVDQEAEKMLVTELQRIIPETSFITEEQTIDQTEGSLIWIIDPLDGTTNFLQKIPLFSISVALMENGVITLGIVYEIMQDLAYTAIKGQGAWINNQPIQVAQKTELKEAIVATGFPYDRDESFDLNMKILQYVILQSRGIRRLGSAALDLAYVASGKLDIYYEKSLNIWDIAAGSLLVEEAGGIITDMQGESLFLQSGELIVGNKHLHPLLLAGIKKQEL